MQASQGIMPPVQVPPAFAAAQAVRPAQPVGQPTIQPWQPAAGQQFQLTALALLAAMTQLMMLMLQTMGVGAFSASPSTMGTGLGTGGMTAVPTGRPGTQQPGANPQPMGRPSPSASPLMMPGGMMNPASTGNTNVTREMLRNAGSQEARKQMLDPLVRKLSADYGVDPNLVHAVIKQESAYDPDAESYVGAKGLMQLMPETAASLGVTDSSNPQDNLRGGIKYLSQKLKAFNGDVRLALAAYNAGEGAVKEYGGIPPFQETKAYVKTIIANYQGSAA